MSEMAVNCLRSILGRYLERYRERIDVVDADRLAIRLQRAEGRDLGTFLDLRDIVIAAAIRANMAACWGTCHPATHTVAPSQGGR